MTASNNNGFVDGTVAVYQCDARQVRVGSIDLVQIKETRGVPIAKTSICAPSALYLFSSADKSSPQLQVPMTILNLHNGYSE